MRTGPGKYLSVLFYFIAFAVGARSQSVAAADDQARQTAYLKALSQLKPIDAHTHILKSSQALVAMLDRWKLHVLDILVPDDKDASRGTLDEQRAEVFAFVHAAHGHASLCTSFDPFAFSNSDFLKNTIAGLNDDFAHGAIAVKVWKNVGMELKDKSGHYVLVDDPRLEPIFKDISAHGKTLIAHQAEPDVAWGPPDPKALDNSYYAEHPEWDMQKIPDAPKKNLVLASRDHLLALNPELRVVGAHLGSMEASVDFIAERFDRYPNFAIDTAARVPHLTLQPPEKVRAFLIKYQDRVLYGTDIDLLKGGDVESTIREWETQLALDWRYFSTSDRFDYQGRTVQGLHLPATVLRKLYHDNAVRWIPGILAPESH
jgi:predicted TIM-barrel fold metal-dependent hydrolase